MLTISNIEVTNITQTRATIRWTTDTVCDSKVYYGLTPAVEQTRSDNTRTLNHSVTLIHLTGSKTYHFQVCAFGLSREENRSPTQTFNTAKEEKVVTAEEGLITSDELVRKAWQKLIIVLPDALSPEMDVMSGYLHAIQNKMIAEQAAAIPTQQAPTEQATTEAESNRLKKN